MSTQGLPTQAPAYLRDGFVIVPNHVASWLHRHVELDRARVNARGEDLAIDAVLIALRHAALAGSANGTADDATTTETPRWTQELTTGEAAQMLAISERAVRLACTRGRLTGQLRAGRWFLNPQDVQNYARARRAA